MAAVPPQVKLVRIPGTIMGNPSIGKTAIVMALTRPAL
jgi:Fe2+ transport system protein B